MTDDDRALAIGRAWLAAEEALPEGWVGPGMYPAFDEWEAWTNDGLRAHRVHAATPEAALLALADALRKERGA